MTERLRDIRLKKPRPSLLDKRDKKAAVEKADEAGSKEAKRRSGGRCEVIEQQSKQSSFGAGIVERFVRCSRRATQIHHMIGGWGMRARGPSALAKHKQHVCDSCHPEITGHVLKLRQKHDRPQWDDVYEREA